MFSSAKKSPFSNSNPSGSGIDLTKLKSLKLNMEDSKRKVKLKSKKSEKPETKSLFFKDSSSYEGEIRDGVPHGKGKMSKANLTL